MSFNVSLQIAAEGLNAERIRMNVISSNLANINTDNAGNGLPYVKKEPVFKTTDFGNYFGVEVNKIENSSDPFTLKYDPSNPLADKAGYVKIPNISSIRELVDMISATRAYQADSQVIAESKAMSQASLKI
jgi:flagellar basal-body rod protein FlgC